MAVDMSLDIIAAIFLFAFSSTITPGPNNILLTSAGLNFGVRRCLGTAAGIYIGFPVMVIAVGLGLGALFSRFAIILQIMNIVGVLYLLYLAYLIATATPQNLEQGSDARPPNFLQMALFQWVNPKAWIMATGAVATYVQPQIDPSMQVLIISFIFFIVAIPCTMLWLAFGAKLKTWIGSPTSQRRFNRAMAGLLVLSLAPIVRNFFS